MDDSIPSQTLRVDENMVLLVRDLLARIIAVRVDPRPLFRRFSRVFLSMIEAV
jgi:hypothetical protein